MLVTLHNASLIKAPRESLSEKNVHTTILKCDMGYDQDIVSGNVAVKSSVAAFLF